MRPRRVVLLFVSALLNGFLVLCGAARVSAQAESPADDVAASKAAFEQGVAAMRAKDFDAAVIAFKASVSLREHPAARCNLALALESSASGVEVDQDRRRARLEAARESYLICASTDRSGRYSGHAKKRAEQVSAVLEDARGPDELVETQPVTKAEHSAVDEAQVAREIDPTRATPVEGSDDGGASPWLTISLIGYGVAAAVFAGGAAFAFDAQSRRDEIDAKVGSGSVPTTVDGARNPVLDEIDDYNQSRDLATAFYASAFLVATLSTSFLIIELLSDDESDASASLVLSPTGAQVNAVF